MLQTLSRTDLVHILLHKTSLVDAKEAFVLKPALVLVLNLFMFTPLKTHDRFDYQAIHKREDYNWPNGARLAVYIGFNLEHFAFGEGLGAGIGPTSPQPDVLNYAWREYGNR
jgi:hypothetical protein